MDSLPLLPLGLIFKFLDLSDQIKCRVLSKKYRSLIDNLKPDELIINLKSYKFRRSNECWYDSQRPLRAGNLIDLSFALEQRYQLFKKQLLETKKFTELKRLKLIYLSRYINDSSNSAQFFAFLIDNLLFLFGKLEHLELEINYETLSKHQNIVHDNLNVLRINHLTKELKLKINCPKLVKLYWSGLFTDSTSFEHPNSVQHLNFEFNRSTVPHRPNLSILSRFSNLKYFHYSFDSDDLNWNYITEFINLDKLEILNYYPLDEDLRLFRDPMSREIISKFVKILEKVNDLKLSNLSVCLNGHKIANEDDIIKFGKSLYRELP